MYYKYEWETKLSDLVGKTFTSVTTMDEDQELVFTIEDGTKYVMYHNQDCCENVRLYDVVGDLQDLVGSPIIRAEENSNSDEYPPDIKHEYEEYDDHFTWTFYRIQTAKGLVVLRWLGESNGYYSEDVDLVKVPKGEA